jgi:hypothetical protein
MMLNLDLSVSNIGHNGFFVRGVVRIHCALPFLAIHGKVRVWGSGKQVIALIGIKDNMYSVS